MSTTRFAKRLRSLGPLLFVPALAARTPAADVHCAVPLGALEITAGEFPASFTAPWPIRWGSGREGLLEPHVVLDGPGEAFVLDLRSEKEWAIRFAARVPHDGDVTGRLVVPSTGVEAPIDVRFRLAAGPDDRGGWIELAEQRAVRRWKLGIPGRALFRSGARYRGNYDDVIRAFEASFAPFRATRVAAADLLPSHFRDLPRAGEEYGTSDVPEPAHLEEHPWTAPRAGIPPVADLLLSRIADDQPALLFPDFGAFLAVLDEADRIGTPLLRLLEEESVEALVRDEYEAQLCLPTRRMSGEPAAAGITAVALTGSDTSLREGADAAVLFETEDPAALLAWMKGRHEAADWAHADAEATSGSEGEVEWFSLRTPDRTVCSTVVSAGSVVMVTNSPVQLDALREVVAGRHPALAARAEVRLLRDRYARGDPEESAFLVVSDPTFRRWAGPGWRIRTSRRIRAAAEFTDAAARSVEEGSQPSQDAGSEYGRLGFLTPVAELAIDRVTNREVLSCRHAMRMGAGVWKYAPVIGARLTLVEGGFDVDASVAALLLRGDLRHMLRVVGDARVRPFDGDPHAEAIYHSAHAIDFDAMMRDDVFGFLGRFGAELTSRFHPIGFFTPLFHGLVLNAIPLEWVGGAVSVSLDADPIWEALGGTDDLWEFLERHFDRFPVAVTVEVLDDAAAAAFLDDSRELCRKFLSGSYTWDVVERGTLRYHRIGETERLRAGRVVPDDWSSLSICVAALPGRLILALDERVLTRAIDRSTAGVAPDVPPWTGESAAMRLDRRSLDAIESWAGVWFEENRQTASWRNLPILNEWRRRFPDEDPVAVHRRLFRQELVCPGGGDYLWNPVDGTVESTAYGSPISPRRAPAFPSLIDTIDSLAGGVTFEGDALRARLELRWK